MLLMGMRNVEIITGVSTLVLSFIEVDSSREGVLRGLLIIAGLVALAIAASSKWLDRRLSRLIAWALRHWTSLDARDYTSLLGLTSGYSVLEMVVGDKSWLANKTLEDLDLPEEGVTVLAIQRADGSFVGAPRRTTIVRPQDKLILYGQAASLVDISERQMGGGGDQARRDAIEAHREILREQNQRENASTLRWHRHCARPRSLTP
jgi:K+/H+ antiporter YhaU regulatory subunit KhtT